MLRAVLIVGGSVVGGLVAVVGTIAAFAASPSAKTATTDPPASEEEPQPVPEAEQEVIPEDKPAVSETPRKVKVPVNSYPSEKRVAADRLKRKFDPWGPKEKK